MNVPLTRDFDLIWDYDKPAETEAEFRKLLEKSKDREYRLELQTQIARCQGLQRQFENAHETLDAIEKECETPDRLRVRYLLERGRVFNSSREKEKALPLFVAAWELALPLHEDFLAADAAHMVAIAGPPHSALEWNERAVAVAEPSEDERAKNWLGSLYNNIGWTYHEQGQFSLALKAFEKALEYRVRQGKRDQILVARWCIGKCLRSMSRIEEALEIQRELQETRELNREPDGYVNEELGECLLAQGKGPQAVEYFAAAYEQLSADPWMAANDPKRLERLKALAERRA